MVKTIVSVASLLILAAVSGPCCAWNKAAHMLSAAIAYNELGENHPEALVGVVALMKSHPQATQFDAELAAFDSEAQRAPALFMYMAKWADDVRGQNTYDHPKWQYVDIPYVPSALTD